MLSDWFDAAAGRTVGVDAAVRISETAVLPVVTAGWFIPMTIGAAVGPILLLLGLVRAKVVGLWLLIFPVVMLALIVSGWPEGPLGVGIAFGLAAVLGALVGQALGPLGHRARGRRLGAAEP